MQTFFRVFNRVESVLCRVLLASFVVLLFVQVLTREFFSYSIPWGEELAVYMFVWFAYFGASYAALLSAHNRVTFQFKLMPKKMAVVLEAISDVIWICFNLYFAYLSFDFIMRANAFWKSQTLGIPMKFFYIILPVAFVLMTIRILQVNYSKFVLGVEVRDPEELEVEKILASGQGTTNDKPE